MYLNCVFELSMILDDDKFQKLLTRAYDNARYMADDEYLDETLSSKGIIVTYRDSQYKKKIKLAVNPNAALNGDKPDSDNALKFIRKLEKRINGYFSSKYALADFSLGGLVLTTDINVGDREKVCDYIRVLQKIGKVKGFSPPGENWVSDEISLCLEGNSNGITFMIYNLEALLRERLEAEDSERKQLKALAKKAEGVLRAEVRLTKPKAIRAYTDEADTAGQIADLTEKTDKVFLDTFVRAVPFGEFYKKDKAIEIINREVADKAMRRRMVRLVELIPEKKSLLLAQKALNYRDIELLMATFGSIKLAPITISKRHEARKLDNIYKYL